MSACIAGCQYIPSAEYFAHWVHHGTLILEAHETYQKRSWRNRSAILGPSKPVFLSVPLKGGKHQQMPITEVEIAYDETWYKIHLSGMQTAYGKTAFFEEIRADLKCILWSKPAKLWDLNLQLIEMIRSLLGIELAFEITSAYSGRSDTTMDLRKGVPAGHSSVNLDRDYSYSQVQRLGKSHQPNLSILDALCHLGPGTIEYLRQYASLLYEPRP